MKARTANPPKTIFLLPVFLSVALLFLGVGGCASTTTDRAVTGPGTPDETQLQHYEMLKSAVEAQSRLDALSALALLQSDVARWHTDVLTAVNAMVDQASITDAVDKEDWALASKLTNNLPAKYGRSQ